MQEKIIAMLAEYKGIDASTITGESTLEALELDSLDVVELVMSLEDEFGVSLTISEDIKSVADIAAAVEAAQG